MCNSACVSVCACVINRFNPHPMFGLRAHTYDQRGWLGLFRLFIWSACVCVCVFGVLVRWLCSMYKEHHSMNHRKMTIKQVNPYPQAGVFTSPHTQWKTFFLCGRPIPRASCTHSKHTKTCVCNQPTHPLLPGVQGPGVIRGCF